MGQIVRGFPDLPSHVQTLTLGGAQYQARLTWRERVAGWYLDLYLLDGTEVALGCRLSPGGLPVQDLSLARVLGGVLIVRGLDGYARGDLGTELELVFYADAELPAEPVPDSNLRVS